MQSSSALCKETLAFLQRQSLIKANSNFRQLKYSLLQYSLFKIALKVHSEASEYEQGCGEKLLKAGEDLLLLQVNCIIISFASGMDARIIIK